MNKAVLISIQPKWVELIASGKKTIEVRKTRPQLKTPFKCYIYCTAERPYGLHLTFPRGDGTNYLAHKKVIGEFMCDKVYDILPHNDGYDINQYECGWKWGEDDSCLTFNELRSYLSIHNGYGWHISDLKIYDKPKELGEFKKEGYMTEEQWLYALYPNTHCHYAAWAKRFNLTRPPQSWCYVEELS